MGDGRAPYKHGPVFGRYWTGEERDRVMSDVVGLFGGTCNGDILDVVSGRSVGVPPADLKGTILKGAASELRLGSDERPLYQDELRWLAGIEDDVVGRRPSDSPSERWRLRRNALMRRRFGMPQLAFDHDRMMDTFGWCDPADASIDDRAMLERADRLTDAAARCAEREGPAIASLLMYDPGEMSNGPARNTVWDCLAEWMDGKGRMPSNPTGRLATTRTAPDLGCRWRQLTCIYYKMAGRKDILGDDVAWIMALTRIERILGKDAMPMEDGRNPFGNGYDVEAVARAITMCGDMLYDTDLPEGFTAQSLLAAMGPTSA